MKKVKLGLLCLLAGVVLSACNKEKEGYSKKSDYKETAFDMDLSMVYVEGGTFTMGTEIFDYLWADVDDDEDNWRPTPHKVTLTSYHISKCEITQAQWKAVMGTTIQQIWTKNRSPWYNYHDSTLHSVGDNYPMCYVSWYDAKAFCDKLSEKTGKKYALPTEAQWEFAARGGTKSKGYKFSGSNTLDDVAWWSGVTGVDNGYEVIDEEHIGNSGDSAHIVGTRAPNELGIHDMTGNVEEWCADWYGPYPKTAVTDPTGPAKKMYDHGRVIRSSNYCARFYGTNDIDEYNMNHHHVSTRGKWDHGIDGKDEGEAYLGFRVVCIP